MSLKTFSYVAVYFLFSDDPNGQALKKRVTKYMRPDLLNLDTLIPYLNKYQLLTQDNMYDLKNPLVPPNKRANELVYHILPSKGPRGFILFVKCLQEETQHLGHQTLANLFTMPPQCDNTSHQDLSTLPSHSKWFWYVAIYVRIYNYRCS